MWLCCHFVHFHWNEFVVKLFTLLHFICFYMSSKLPRTLKILYYDFYRISNMRTTKVTPLRLISTGSTFRNRLSEHTEQLKKCDLVKRSTVDPATVEFHSKMSSRWWDTNGEMHALHSLNPLRVQFVRDGLANTGFKIKCPYLPLEGIKILDVGCGGGLYSESLARTGANVTGIDVSSELITVAKGHAVLDPSLDGKLNYVQTTIEDFALINKGVFDAVVASEIIEHVNNKDLFLKCCVSTLKSGGSIFLTTFNKTLSSWLGGIITAEHILKLIPKGTHDWNKFVTPAEMQSILETCGCKTKLIHGLFYNPLKREWSWRASTAINYALHADKHDINHRCLISTKHGSVYNSDSRLFLSFCRTDRDYELLLDEYFTFFLFNV